MYALLYVCKGVFLNVLMFTDKDDALVKSHDPLVESHDAGDLFTVEDVVEQMGFGWYQLGISLFSGSLWVCVLTM